MKSVNQGYEKFSNHIVFVTFSFTGTGREHDVIVFGKNVEFILMIHYIPKYTTVNELSEIKVHKVLTKHK